MLRLIRAWCYALARFLGDVNAIRRGPRAMGRRVLRRAAGRATGRMLGKLFR
jgi:hypothetical protein